MACPDCGAEQCSLSACRLQVSNNTHRNLQQSLYFLESIPQERFGVLSTLVGVSRQTVRLIRAKIQHSAHRAVAELAVGCDLISGKPVLSGLENARHLLSG